MYKELYKKEIYFYNVGLPWYPGMRCDNFIPSMTAAYRWENVSDKHLCPSTHGHVLKLPYESIIAEQ